ncbi:MAG: DNA polymerase III subunit epsilon [Pseudomonadota bacterium]
MREIVFDTETTGIAPDHPDEKERDRVVEIGCVELINLERTGAEFHIYLNPERHVSEEVVRVHGLTREFLNNHPKFADVVQQFLDFVGDAPLVAHNAGFDRNFINAELRRIGLPLLPDERFVDTLALAKKKYPGASCSLDALARRLRLDARGFDLAARKGAGGHGALLDSRMLAEIYLELKGGREQRFDFGGAVKAMIAQTGIFHAKKAPRPVPLPPRIDADEEAAHAAFIGELGADALWRKYG